MGVIVGPRVIDAGASLFSVLVSPVPVAAGYPSPYAQVECLMRHRGEVMWMSRPPPVIPVYPSRFLGGQGRERRVRSERFPVRKPVSWLFRDTSAPSAGNLDSNDCWDLLAAAVVGRLALIVDDHPEIFPVNYVLEQRSIVFRSAGGTKLWGANAFRPAALEIDGYDPVREEAWSVVARGETEVMTSAEEKAAVDALHLEPWQPGAKDNYIRLRPRALTGRRFKVNKPDVWNTRLTDDRRSSFE